MAWEAVTSSALQAVYFSDRLKKLFVRFQSGKQWAYDVAKAEYIAMLAAPSQGKYFAAHIKGQFDDREYSDLEMQAIFAADDASPRAVRQPRKTAETQARWIEFREKYGLRAFF